MHLGVRLPETGWIAMRTFGISRSRNGCAGIFYNGHRDMKFFKALAFCGAALLPHHVVA